MVKKSRLERLVGRELSEFEGAAAAQLDALQLGMPLDAVYALLERLYEGNTTDPLTRAYNRRKLEEDLEIQIARVESRYNVQSNHRGVDATGGRKHDLSLVYLDIDHFKQINDQYGHAEGDRVLKEVVRVIKEQLREYDQQNVYRVGGEEFVVLVPESDLDGGYIVAERIRTAIEREVKVNGKATTISSGVTNYQGVCRDKDEFLQTGDRALYTAKKGGRNCTERYAPPQDVATQDVTPPTGS